MGKICCGTVCPQPWHASIYTIIILVGLPVEAVQGQVALQQWSKGTSCEQLCILNSSSVQLWQCIIQGQRLRQRAAEKGTMGIYLPGQGGPNSTVYQERSGVFRWGR